MVEKWQKLYKEMLAGIEKFWHLQLSESEQVEWAFKLALNCWDDVKKELAVHSFENKTEEIDFYKNIKPKFTSYIEYLPMVYLGLSYQPKADDAIRSAFWLEETKMLQKFIDKNTDFVMYYKSGCTHKDLQYFLPENYDLANYIVSKIYETDGEFMTSHDHLVAVLLAHEMYHEYAKKKLAQVDNV
jgi:RteC protein